MNLFFPFCSFFSARSMDEMVNLFKPIHELVSPTQTFPEAEKNTVPDSLYYMTVCLNKKKRCGKGNLEDLFKHYDNEGVI